MDYHSTGLLNWQTKTTRMVGSGTGIQVRTSFDELIYSMIKGIHPKRLNETGGLYLYTIILSKAMPQTHVCRIKA